MVFQELTVAIRNNAQWFQAHNRSPVTVIPSSNLAWESNVSPENELKKGFWTYVCVGDEVIGPSDVLGLLIIAIKSLHRTSPAGALQSQHIVDREKKLSDLRQVPVSRCGETRSFDISYSGSNRCRVPTAFELLERRNL